MQSLDTWHLAGNENEIKVTDFELQLWRVFYGFQRWQEECERNANGSILSSNELAILHIIRMKNRPKTLTDIERLLNRNDTHNIRYSINKLLKIGFIKKTQSVYSGKNYYFEITEEGKKDTDNYSRMRKFILIHMFKESGLDLDEMAKNLTKIKAIYDEADRAVAQNLIRSQTVNQNPSINQNNNPGIGKILLVEDHITTARVTQAILEDLHYQVDIAGDGDQALDLVAKQQYDIIFMDIGLSDMSGYEVTKKIRANTELPNNRSPIIGLTAHESDENKKDCIEAGMNAVSTKPLVKAKIEDIFSMFVAKRPKMEKTFEQNASQSDSKELPKIKGEIIDLELGAKLVGGDLDFAKEAIQMLVDSFSEELIILDKACKTSDIEIAQAVLHKLRGGISYCGVPRLKEACIQFDNYLKTAKIDLIPQYYESLLVEFNLLKEKLKN